MCSLLALNKSDLCRRLLHRDTIVAFKLFCSKQKEREGDGEGRGVLLPLFQNGMK